MPGCPPDFFRALDLVFRSPTPKLRASISAFCRWGRNLCCMRFPLGRASFTSGTKHFTLRTGLSCDGKPQLPVAAAKNSRPPTLNVSHVRNDKHHCIIVLNIIRRTFQNHKHGRVASDWGPSLEHFSGHFRPCWDSATDVMLDGYIRVPSRPYVWDILIVQLFLSQKPFPGKHSLAKQTTQFGQQDTLTAASNFPPRHAWPWNSIF